MKIKKLIEATANADDTKKNIEQSVQTAVKDSTGKKLSDKDASAVAGEIQADAKATNSDFIEIALQPEDFKAMEIKNELTDRLDDCYLIAKENMADVDENPGAKVDSVSNLAIVGLPGSGKTSIVRAWAQSKGVILVSVNASSNKIDVEINGVPVRDTSDPKDPNHLVMAYDDRKLSALGQGPSILLVDEYNRQKDTGLRRPFLDLFADKRSADGHFDFTKTLLFSVICINPYSKNGGYRDEGVAALMPPEKGRFYDQITWNSTKTATELYFDGIFENNMASKGVLIPGSTAAKKYKLVGCVTKDALEGKKDKWIDRELLKHDLVTTLINYLEFNFDSADDATQKELTNGGLDLKGFYQRDLTMGLNGSFGDKARFLAWVDRSTFRQKIKDMIHAALDDYEANINALRNEYCVEHQYKADAEGLPIKEVADKAAKLLDVKDETPEPSNAGNDGMFEQPEEGANDQAVDPDDVESEIGGVTSTFDFDDADAEDNINSLNFNNK